jgi:molybdate/tungstate transport system substrate-binding protein
MMTNAGRISRRTLLSRSKLLLAAPFVSGLRGSLQAQTTEVLAVASAGSIGPMLSGPIKQAILQALRLDLHSYTRGADAMARALLDGSVKADVFIPITAGPMLSVLHAGEAEHATPIARTEMVIVYSPKSRFAAQFDRAAKGEANWWEILQTPGMRFARSNPSGDPGGRNTVFTMMLAAKKYKQPDLVEKVLGSILNPAQITAGSGNQERLIAGELDATSSYKAGTTFSKLPYITLPKDINLSGQSVHAEHPDVRLTLDGMTFYPEPLVFYAAVLKHASNPEGAAAFVEWLSGATARKLFQQYRFDLPGVATALSK